MRNKRGYLILPVLMLCLCGCAKEPAVAEPMEPVVQEEAEVSEEEPVFVPTEGRIENGIYVNDSLDLSFVVSEGMYALDTEQIQEVIALAREDMGEADGDVFPEGQRFDAMIYLPDMLSNVIVLFRDLSVAMPGENISEKEYAEREIEALQQTSDAAYLIGEITNKSLAEKEFTYYKADGQKGIVQYSYLKKMGNYMVQILITEADGSEETMEEFLGSFQKIRK